MRERPPRRSHLGSRRSCGRSEAQRGSFWPAEFCIDCELIAKPRLMRLMRAVVALGSRRRPERHQAEFVFPLFASASTSWRGARRRKRPAGTSKEAKQTRPACIISRPFGSTRALEAPKNWPLRGKSHVRRPLKLHQRATLSLSIWFALAGCSGGARCGRQRPL